MSFKPAHSLQSRGLRSGLPEGQFLALKKARRFLRSHSQVILVLLAGTEYCWMTHSWPLKRVMLEGFTSPCSISSWYTQAPVSPLSRKNEKVSPPDWTPPPPYHEPGGVMASLHPQNTPQGTIEHKSCSACYTAPWWWRFSLPWRGCFRARARHATGGDALPCPSELLQSRSKVSLWVEVRFHV